MSLSKRNSSLLVGLTVLAGLVTSLVLTRRGQSAGTDSVTALLAAQSAANNANSLSHRQLFDQRYQGSRRELQMQMTNAAPDYISPMKGQLVLKLRAIGLSRATHDVTADQQAAREVLKQIQSSPLFDAANFSGKLSDEEPPGTFTFNIAARVKKPLEL